MKILIVAPYFTPRVGGLENYALAVALQMKAAGHNVVVVTSNHLARRRQTHHQQGLRIIRLPAWANASNTPVNPLWYWQLKHIIRQEAPAAIVAHTPVPFIADMAVRAAGRIPVVLTYHNDLAKFNPLLRAVLAVYWTLLGKHTLERADRIVATSQFYADNSPFLALHKHKIVIIPPGINPLRFKRSLNATTLRQGLGPDKVVLFVGSMAKTHAHKGLDLLIGAVADLRHDGKAVQLVAVGQGDDLPRYRRLAQAAGIADNVTFTGFISDSDLPGYYAAADVFVLPSTSQAEGFGMVLVEAAACGTPVIGTDVGGIPAAMALIGSPNLAQPNRASISSVLHRVLTADTPAPTFDAPTWQQSAERTIDAIVKATRPRVTLIQNIIAPYRLAMFAELAKTTNLEVLYTERISADRLWEHNMSDYNFFSRTLPSIGIGPVVVNPWALATLRRSRFDVLITGTDPDTAPLSLTGLALAKLHRQPIILWSEVTDEVVQSFPSLAYATTQPQKLFADALTAIISAYRHVFFRSARMSLAFSDHARRFLNRHGVPDASIERTYQIMPRQLLPEVPTASRTGRTFLYVGYLNPRKDVALLIRAFMGLDHKGAKLIIVGGGGEEQALRQLATHDRRITFAGYLEGTDKARLYASSDVLVLPTRRDCWGLVVNEAVHYGLAVIVSDAAAACELINGKSGIVVAQGSRTELQAAMHALITNRTRLEAMQAHNRGRSEVSEVKRAIDGFNRAIMKVLS